MSSNTIEGILWGLGEDPERRKNFRKDPDRYLAQFPLDEAERRMVRTMDLKALEAHGVSNMLMMNSYNAINGGSPILIFDFLKKMNHGSRINRMKIPRIPFLMIHLALGIRNVWLGILSALGLKKRFG